MFTSLKNLVASPLTKYMGIAILVLASALGGAMYLSYKFYGQKEVAEVESERLEDVAKEERIQTKKAKESQELLDKAISDVRENEKELDKASEKLQDEVTKKKPTQPTGGEKNASETTTNCSDDFLTDSDVRLLQQAHCLSDGDVSDCNFGKSE